MSNDKLISYLTNRSQFVLYHYAIQNEEEVICGVSQESSERMNLFNLYLSDTVNVSNKFKYVLSADKTFNSHVKLFITLEIYGTK